MYISDRRSDYRFGGVGDAVEYGSLRFHELLERLGCRRKRIFGEMTVDGKVFRRVQYETEQRVQSQTTQKNQMKKQEIILRYEIHQAL